MWFERRGRLVSQRDEGCMTAEYAPFDCTQLGQVGKCLAGTDHCGRHRVQDQACGLNGAMPSASHACSHNTEAARSGCVAERGVRSSTAAPPGVMPVAQLHALVHFARHAVAETFCRSIGPLPSCVASAFDSHCRVVAP
jgi:hypothetical protein